MRTRKQTRLLTITAMFTAVIFISTRFLGFPNPAGAGVIHPADAIMYVAAVLLPLPYAMFAGAAGMALANVAGAGGAMYAPFTLIIKPLMLLLFSRHGKALSGRNITALVPAFIINVAGYTFANFIIGVNQWIMMPGIALNSTVSTVLFVLLAGVIDRIRLKEQLDLE
ncbi:MAG: ECF transporter S component [Oscillospiraceae bacterium]|nr:ECF transporter S component [Oscillospiraceae bacterium]